MLNFDSFANKKESGTSFHDRTYGTIFRYIFVG